MADETTRVDQWLQARLAGDGTLIALLTDGAAGVHADEVPPAGEFPAVVHQFQGGADQQGASTDRIMLSGLWVVKAIVAGRDYLAAQPAADRVDVLLHGAASSSPVDDGTVFSCVREQPFRLAERTEDGQDFRHLGGVYRIEVQVPGP